jgi:PAS domain S-box-containing protein
MMPDMAAAEATKVTDRDIMGAVRDPLLVLDEGLRVTAASRSFYSTFRVMPEQTMGRALYDLGDRQWDIPALRTLLAAMLRSDGQFDDYQVEHDFPNLGPKTMLLNGRRMTDGDGRGDRILLSIQDITALRRSQAALKLHERTWFETTLASIGDAVIATDAAARVTFLNPAAERMTGWAQREAAGRPLIEVFRIVNEDTRRTVESPVSKAIRLGAIVGLANHTLLIARDGTERAIDDSAAPIRDGEGGIIGVVMVFHDITDRRAAEVLLEASEVRYRRLFEAAHDGILILDTGTRRITEVNPFILSLLDYPREHFVGKELWEIGIFHDKEANKRAMEELHRSGSIRFEDLPLQDRNGHRHPVEIVANVYQEGHESVIQCNIRDIGERVQFQRERDALLASEQASRMEAETANRSKDLFLATLSHEVRTPLNAILGWATILRNGKCDEADIQEGMEVIERNCKIQAQLIEDVLDVSRIVSGKMQLQIGPCELVDVIHAAIATVQSAADAKSLRFEVDLDPAASRCSCDVQRLTQVVWNLLTNAVKFTSAGKAIRVTLSRERSSARIQVSDEGQGISPEFLPRVFDRFRQAESTTRRKHGGLGLGLSIVRHLVELHGGTVRADSPGLGLGSTFTVDLPVRAVESAVPDPGPGGTFLDAPAVEIKAVRLDGLRVLVVDDEADARRVLSRVLGDAGATVTVANSVAAAVEAVAEMKPQVLLSDIAMPDRDGYDLIRQLRASGLMAKDLPAVALTAFAHKEDRLRVLLAGFQVHVPKPVDPHELVAVVATLAGRTG